MAESKLVKGYIAVTAEDRNLLNSKLPQNQLGSKYSRLLKEAFKGEVDDEQIRFPKELGAVHPFNMEKVEKVTNNVGIVNAGVSKMTDSIMGDFTIEVEDIKIQKIIDSFVEDSDLLSHLRPWIKEGIGKGNGYMDLTDILDNKLQVLNANGMFVKRDKHGTIKEYNQFLDVKKTKVKLTKNNVVNFKPKEIAHLKANANPGEPYGLGFVWPNMKTIDNYASSEIDLHKLISRKAGAPIHVQVGVEGESVQSGDIDNFKTLLQFMNNRTEWVTDRNVQMSVLDFKDVGKNLTDTANHDLEQFSIGMQIPMVILGVANIPEGLAKVQLESYQRLIQSIRIQIEDTIETKILQPYLLTQGLPKSEEAPGNKGLSSKINFVWELPGEEVKNQRLTTIQTALSSPLLSPELRASLEKEYADVLGLEDVSDLLEEPEEARKRVDEENRKREEEEIKQPEVPGEKPTAKESAKVITKCSHSPKGSKVLTEEELINMPVSEYVNISEIPGFNFSDYLVKILQNLRLEKFIDLRALTELDVMEGLLPGGDIEKLRMVLRDGFKKNKTIREIEKDINQSINLKDRAKLEGGELKVTLNADKRPNMIARTETVRLANQGLKSLYEENDIGQYRYLAAVDDRTSSICLSLNGQVFDVEDGMPGVNMPPMHVNCRSTIIGLIE